MTIDELDVDIHFVKESVMLSRDSPSPEKFMHGIKVLMAKNYIEIWSRRHVRASQRKLSRKFGHP